MTASQAAVLKVISEHGPLPDAALVPLVQHVAQERMSSSGIRSRRHELAVLGKVKETDRVVMPSGRKASVWSIA